ncbi:MAG: hypothetical protein K1000chlam3_00410 [Chlamydiae bacterium]|nr:hypothetical protein [Chlamydiota bacterium]
MRRRRRKWPFFICIPLCLFIVTTITFRHFRVKSAPSPVQIEYHPITWSSFTEHKRLQMLIQGFAIKSLIDIPCVDFESLAKAGLTEIRYIGITSSKDQARAMQTQFGSKLRTFLNMEITVDTLPKADLILCWDKLCTMTPREARGAILQFKKSGTHFLLMHHFPEIKKNHKNYSGGLKPVNWTLPPYNFPEPIIHIMEKGEHGMESLALWNLETL